MPGGWNHEKIFQSSDGPSGQFDSTLNETNIISPNLDFHASSGCFYPLLFLAARSHRAAVRQWTPCQDCVTRLLHSAVFTEATIHTHIHTYGQFRIANSPTWQIWGMLEEYICRHGPKLHTVGSMLSTRARVMYIWQIFKYYIITYVLY